MTADTSVVVAALSAWHDQHEDAAQALEHITALPAQALLESYTVLTRLPAGLAVTPAAAASVLSSRFPDPPLRLPAARRDQLLQELSGLGIGGGASYDALVALEAQAHGRLLLSLDRRAQLTYARLGVPFRAVAAGGTASG